MQPKYHLKLLHHLLLALGLPLVVLGFMLTLLFVEINLQGRESLSETRSVLLLLGSVLCLLLAYLGSRRVANSVEIMENEHRRLAAIVDATPDMVGIAKEDGTILYLNQEGRKLFGLPLTGSLKEYSAKQRHPEWALKLIREKAIPIAKKQGSWQGETAFLDNDGREIPISQVIIYHRNTNSEEEYFSTIMRDLSQEKESEEKLRCTLNSIAEAVIATDLQGNITWLNPVAQKYAIPSEHESYQQDFCELFPLLDLHSREPLPNPVIQVSQQQDSLANESYKAILHSSQGQGTRVTINYSPILSPRREMVGVVVVFRDISRETLLEERLRQAQKMEAIGNLAGGIAHDFNNMLSVILGSADMLELLVQQEESRYYLKILLNSAQQAANLTSKLLSFARSYPDESAPVDLNKICQEVMDILRRTLDKQIALNCQLWEGKAITRGDESELKNMLINLALNARDAMPEGGILIIATKLVKLDQAFCQTSPFQVKPGSFIEIRVSDTGRGIPEEMQQKIFEPFFTTKEVGKGTGFGLATVYATVKSHGGAIEVQSWPEQGASFQLYFPEMTHEYQQENQEETTILPGKGKILVVDDEEGVCSITQARLEKMGYEVVCAHDGAEAVALFQQQDFDLVILDLIMPGKSAEETFYELQRIRPVKVIIISGMSPSQLTLTNQLLKAGALAFLQKPFSYQTLSLCVYEALCEK